MIPPRERGDELVPGSVTGVLVGEARLREDCTRIRARSVSRLAHQLQFTENDWLK